MQRMSSVMMIVAVRASLTSRVQTDLWKVLMSRCRDACRRQSKYRERDQAPGATALLQCREQSPNSPHKARNEHLNVWAAVLGKTGMKNKLIPAQRMMGSVEKEGTISKRL